MTEVASVGSDECLVVAEAGVEVGEILHIVGSIKPPGLEARFQSSHRSSLFYIRSDAGKGNPGSNFYQTVKISIVSPTDPENAGKLTLVNPRSFERNHGFPGNMNEIVKYILYSNSHVLYASSHEDGEPPPKFGFEETRRHGEEEKAAQQEDWSRGFCPSGVAENSG
jgi:hypothetical protein